MNSKFAKLGGILIVFVALAALIGSTMTFAQDDTPDQPDAPILEEPSFGPNFGNPQGQQGQRGQLGQRGPQLFTPEERDAALADALGISAEELATAKEEAHATLIQQAVDDGKITQEQADAMISGKGLRTVIKDIFNKEDMQTAVATALGMSVEELEAARADGKRLDDIAAEQGVELSAVQEAVKAAHEAALQQAVEDGLITQEQADQLQEHAGRRGGPRGGKGGHGNGGGQFQGQPEAPLGENG